MKTLFGATLLLGLLSAPLALYGQTAERARQALKAGCCETSPQAARVAAKTTEPVSLQVVPSTGEKVLVGRIENLIPIGVVTVLGCDRCAAEAVGWALQKGSSTEDIDRALTTLEAMQNLDCFNQTFGAEAAGRMAKPLEAGRRALEQAMARNGK